MPFDSLFGLDGAVYAFQKALKADQLAGTYLFVGPPGVGKTALARAFAEAAACTGPDADEKHVLRARSECSGDACGTCESCLRAAAGTQPEIVTIRPAGDQTQIWQFWDRDNRPSGALQHTLPFAPTVGRCRVYILERADTLTEAAANSLLKVLEEPPSYALFVLLSPHPSRMLPTILSRAQLVRLMPAPVDALADWLASTLALAPDRARTFAAFAEGKTGLALRLARNTAFEADIARVVEFAAGIPGASPLRALKIGETIRKLAGSLKALTAEDEDRVETASASSAAGADHPPATNGPKTGPNGGEDRGNEENAEPTAKERVGRRHLGTVLDLLIAFYRDLLTLRLEGPQASIMHGTWRATLADLAAAGGPERWMRCLDALLTARRRLEQNASIPLLADWLALRLVD